MSCVVPEYRNCQAAGQGMSQRRLRGGWSLRSNEGCVLFVARMGEGMMMSHPC